MKTITVKYRDIAIGEVRKCFPDADEAAWNSSRGQLVEIIVPSNVLDPRDAGVCREPLYREVGTNLVACPHIAEIGD